METTKKEKEFYEMKLGCMNCLDVRDYKVPYGKLLVNWKKEIQCPMCGCYNTLTPVQTNKEA